jgi:hypothetical protein
VGRYDRTSCGPERRDPHYHNGFECMPPNWFRWETVGGDEHEGEVIDTDSNVLIVRCTDGVVRAVEG